MKLAVALLLTAMTSPAVADEGGTFKPPVYYDNPGPVVDERNWKLLTQTLSNRVRLYTQLTKSECEAKRHELVGSHQGVTYDDFVIIEAVCFQ